MKQNGFGKNGEPNPLRGSLCIGILLALLVIFFRRVIFTHSPVVLGSPILVDLTNQWYPWRLFGFGMLKEGAIPLWNPYCFCGYPFVANWQSAIFYPLNGIFLILPVRVALNYSFIVHVFLSGVFTYLYMRLIIGDRVSSCVSAITVMFSAQLVARIFAGHLAPVCVMAWLPLELLLAEKGIRTRRAAYFVLCGFVFAVQTLAGHPQMLFYSAIAVFIYVVCRMLAEGRQVKPLLLFAGFLVVAAAVALGLAAVQILPCREFAAHSSRQAMTYREAAGASFPPENLATLLVPEIFGDFVTVRGWCRTFLWEASSYIGIFPLALAILALVYRRNALTALFTIMGAVFFVIALGGYTPVLSFLFYHVPGFNLIRGNAKAFFVTAYCLSFLAGIGCRLLIGAPSPRDKTLRRSCATLMILLAICFMVLAAFAVSRDFRILCGKGFLYCRRIFILTGDEPPRPSDITSLVSNGALCARGVYRSMIFLGLAILAIGLRLKGYMPRLATGILIAAAVVVDLWSFNTRYIITSPEAYCWWPRDIVAFFKGDSSFYRTLRDIRVPVPGVNQNMNDGIFSFEGYETSTVACFKEFCDSSGVRSEDAAEGMARPERTKFISLANIKYIIVPASVRGQFPDYIARFDNGYVRIYENIRVLPRAWVVHHAMVAHSPRDALRLMQGDTFDPRFSVVLDEEPGISLPQAGSPSEAEIVDYRPGEVIVRCRLGEAGILVLSDTYYPGWRVTLDGRPGRVLRADYAFQGVPLGRGEHTVSFSYRPAPFRLGAAVSIIALCATVTVLRMSCRRQGRESSGWPGTGQT